MAWSSVRKGGTRVGGVAKAEVAAARGGSATLDERLDNIESDVGTTNSEVVEARGAFFNLDARLDAIDNANLTQDGSITAIQSEIVNARGGKGNLDTRLDDYDPGAWQSLSFGTGWQNFDTTNYQAAQYRKYGTGRVEVRGLVTRVSGTGTTIGTLPAGYRPAKRHLFVTWADAGVARIDVRADGTITQEAGTQGFVSLGTIAFDTA